MLLPTAAAQCAALRCPPHLPHLVVRPRTSHNAFLSASDEDVAINDEGQDSMECTPQRMLPDECISPLEGSPDSSMSVIPAPALLSSSREARKLWRRTIWKWAGLGVIFIAAVASNARLFVQYALAAYHSYEAAALTRPIITKSATSAIAYFLGDLIAQRFSPEPFRSGRVLRASTAGALSHGPQLHYWTMLMEASPFGLWAKVVLDQTVFSLYLNAAYCVLTESMQQKPLGGTFRKARAAAWPCLKAGWRFWPFAHALTYSIVPFHLRVLWVDVLEVAWVAVLSTCVARSSREAGTASDATASGDGLVVPTADLTAIGARNTDMTPNAER